MSGNAISSSIFNLRFMQNARLSKQLKEAMMEPEQAHIQDDGHWEVDQAVRDAWGVSSSSSIPSITYEESYLPFLFPSLAADDENQPLETPIPTDPPRGRRLFNNKGEVKNEPETITELQNENKATISSTSKGSRVHPNPRPMSISGSSSTLRGFPEGVKKKAKTAKELIYDNTGVGVDLRQVSRTTNPPVPPTRFLKPPGVDDPKDTKRPPLAADPSGPSSGSKSGTPPPNESDVNSDHNPPKSKPESRSRKIKRERSIVDQTDGESSKRKKTKKSAR